MVKLSVISQREVEDTLQDFEKRRYLILSALRAQKNLSTAAFFTKRERSSKVSSTSLWRPVHRLFIHALVLSRNPGPMHYLFFSKITSTSQNSFPCGSSTTPVFPSGSLPAKT